MIKLFQRYRDVIAGAVFLAISAVMFWLTFYFKRLTLTKIGSDFVPKIVFGMLMVLSIVLIVQSLQKLKHQPKSNTEAEAQKSSGQSRVWITLILIAAYIAMMSYLGFMISTVLYLFIQFAVLAEKGSRRYGLFAIIAVLTASITYVVFLKVFQLMLPAGILG